MRGISMRPRISPGLVATIPGLCFALCRPMKRLLLSNRCSRRDRKSTRLNSSHGYISYAVFCLKKKIYSRVNSKATTQWRKTESANGVHLEGVASDNRSICKGNTTTNLAGKKADMGKFIRDTLG